MKERHIRGIPAILVIGLLTACGGGGGGAEGGGAEGEGAMPAGEAAAPAVDPAVAATIRGSVAFQGTAPAPQPIDMAEEPDCAAKHATPPTTQSVAVSNGKLANVFVYVKSGLSGSFPPSSTPVVIDQDGCRYTPHVLGIQAKQPLLIKNSDPVLHNINTQPTTNRGFNVSQPRQGMETRREFSAAEIMIPVKCDVHGWMHAYIGVTPHPYHAVSGADGSFAIAGLPPGDYVIEAWHEVYGTQTQNVSVGAAETKEISFNYSSDMAADAVVPLGEPLELHGDHGAAD